MRTGPKRGPSLKRGNEPDQDQDQDQGLPGHQDQDQDQDQGQDQDQEPDQLPSHPLFELAPPLYAALRVYEGSRWR